MADTVPLTELDLYGEPQSEAARRARARAASLLQQQYVSGLAMQSDRPNIQKMGETEFAQAGRERQGLQDMGSRVLATSLAQERNDIARMQAAKELAALQQQIHYQTAQLALATKQFQETQKENRVRNFLAKYAQYREGFKTVPPGLIEQQARAKGAIAAKEAGVGQIPVVGAPLAGLLTTGPRAEEEAVQKLIEKGGYRTEQPMDISQFAKSIGEDDLLGHLPAGEETAAPSAEEAPKAVPSYSIVGPGKTPGKVVVRRSDGTHAEVSPEAARKLVGGAPQAAK